MAAGLGYVASGWFVGHDTHIPILLPAAWLPWVLYGLMRATRSGEWMVGTLIAALALAMQAVCAGFQLILYAALASPFLVLLPRLANPLDTSRSRILGAFVSAGVVAGALGVGIAACQVVPTFTMSEWSYRSTVGGAEFTAFGARSLTDLALVLSPGALGGVWENPAPQNEVFLHAGRRARGRSSGRVP